MSHNFAASENGSKGNLTHHGLEHTTKLPVSHPKDIFAHDVSSDEGGRKREGERFPCL